MRLTVEVLSRCPQVTNALDKREVDLRGRALTLLDETSLLQLADLFDVLNFSDNALTTLEAIPPMPRVSSIIAHRNQLRKLHPSIFANVPNVETFSCDLNQFSNAVDLVMQLRQWKLLRRVTVDGSPVASDPQLRQLLILNCPNLIMINYSRVTEAERKEVQLAAPLLREALAKATGATSSTGSGVEKVRKRGRNANTLQAGPTSSETAHNASSAAAANDDDDDAAYTRQLDERLLAAETEEELLAIQEELDARQRRKAQRREFPGKGGKQ